MQFLQSFGVIELVIDIIAGAIGVVGVRNVLVTEDRVRVVVLGLNLLVHLLDLEVVQVLVLGHQVLNGLIDLLSGLDDHVVDIHVSFGAVRLLLGEVAFLHLLDSLQGRALAHQVNLLGLDHLLSLLLKVNDLNVGHEHLGVGLQVLDVLDGLDKRVLFVTRELHLHLLLVFLQLGVLVERAVGLLELAQLLGDVLSSEAHSVILQLIDDVGILLFLLNQLLLHLNIILSSTNILALVCVLRRETAINFATAQNRGLGQLLEERGGPRLSTRLIAAPVLGKDAKMIGNWIVGLLLEGKLTLRSLVLDLLVLLDPLLDLLLLGVGLFDDFAQLLVEGRLLDLELLVLALDRVERLDFGLGGGETLLERGLGRLEEADLSLVLDLLLHVLLVLGDQVLDLVLEGFGVLDLRLDSVGDFHPRSGIILELVDEEDLIDIDQSLLIVAVILLLNLLDQSLELVVIEQLRNVLLDCVHDTVPVLTLDNIRISSILPNDLDDVELLVEALVDDEVGHVQVLLAVVLGIDVVQLEDHVEKTAVDELRFLREVDR